MGRHHHRQDEQYETERALVSGPVKPQEEPYQKRHERRKERARWDFPQEAGNEPRGQAE